MPGVAVASDTVTNGALVPFSDDVTRDSLAIYPLNHGLTAPISRLAISWSRGNSLRVSLFATEPSSGSPDADQSGGGGGKVLEVKLSGGDPEITDAHLRRIAYGSVSPFALLQSRRSELSVLSKASSMAPSYHIDW